MKAAENSELRSGRPFVLAFVILAAGLITAAFGSVALLGWVLGLPRLASFGAGRMPMAPSTAVLFLLFGAAIGVRAGTPLSHRAFRISVVAGCLVTLLALLWFLLGCLNFHWAVEHLGLNITGTFDGASTGHTSPVTAFCFLLASGSFLASLSPSATRSWRAVLALGFAGLLLATSFIFLLAYCFGTPLLHGGTFIPSALNTILAFVTLGLALLALARRPVGLVSGSREDDSRTAFAFALIFLLLAAGILSLGYIYYRIQEHDFRAAVGRELSTIAELKVSELVEWRADHLADGGLFFKNPSFSALVRRFFEQPADADAQRQLLDWIDKFPLSHGFSHIRLMDTECVTRLSSPAGLEPPCSETMLAAFAALESGQEVFQDFNRHDFDQPIYLALLVPILGEADGRPPLGVLVLHIDPATHLYPQLKRWPTSSLTSETLLIRRDGNDVLYLNDLRYQSNAALALRVPLTRTEVPAVRAVLGQTGIMPGLDYRGVPVIAAVQAVTNSPWFLVAKMDTEEVYAPIRKQFWSITALIGALLLGAGAGVGLVWRQQRVRFYRERAASAETLRETQHYLENLFHHANAPIIVWDPQRKITQFNQAFETLTGRRASEVIGQPLEILFPSAVLETPTEFIKKTASGERREAVEVSILHVRGDIRTVLWNSATLFTPDGKTPVATIAQGQDITARKQAEETLRLKNLVFDVSIAANSVAGLDGVINEVNDAFLLCWGYRSKEEVIGHPISYFFNDTNEAEAIVSALDEKGQWEGDFTAKKRDGSIFIAHTLATVVRNEDGKVTGYQSSIVDITARKQAEEKLLTIMKAVESTSDAVGISDAQGRHVFQNKALSDLFGYATAEELQAAGGGPVVVKDLAVARQMFENIMGGKSWAGELDMVTKSGRVFPAYERADAVLDNDGKVIGLVGIITDITERKQAEAKLQLTLAALERSNQELEQFAYVASHDLQEPLRMISSYTQLLAERFAGQLDDKTKKWVHYTVDGAFRMQALINDLLAYSRVGSQGKPLAPTAVQAVLNLAIRNLTATIEENRVTITHDALPTVRADAAQLVLVFQNLLANAIKFQGADLPRVHVSAQDRGREWVFAVKDNGIGIEPQHAQRVFVLFQRLHTRAEYSGTGIGLAVCKRVVERHAGKIWFESEPGKGSTFFFTVPK